MEVGIGYVKLYLQSHAPLDIELLVKAMRLALERQTYLMSRGGMHIEQIKAETVEEAHTLVASFVTKIDPISCISAYIVRFCDKSDFIGIIANRQLVDPLSLCLYMCDVKLLYEDTGMFSLHNLEMEYDSFAKWKEDHSMDGMYSQQLAFFQNSLSSELAALQLPMDNPYFSEASKNVKYHQQNIEVSEDLSDKLRALASSIDISFRSLLLAAYACLLSQYSSSSDFVVGVHSSCQRYVETRDIVGSFENWIPLRLQFLDSPTAYNFLKRVHEQFVKVQANHDVPLSKLKETLKFSKPFNVAFEVYAHAAEDYLLPAQATRLLRYVLGLDTGDGLTKPLELGGINMYSVDPEQWVDVCDDDLRLVGVSAPVLRLALRYNAEKYNEETVQRMATHYTNVLRAFLNIYDTPTDLHEPPKLSTFRVDDINLLDAQETEVVLSKFSHSSLSVPMTSECVHELVERQALQTPDAIAVELGNGDTLTYRELDTRSNQLANFLLLVGVKHEMPVPVLMHRGINLVISWLAVLKAGAAIMPMDPAFPDERIRVMVEDGQASIMITEKSLKHKTPQLSGHLVVFDRDWDRLIHLGSTERPTTSDDDSRHPLTYPSSLAYVIYTSGSTGKPKGVMLEHGSLVNYIRWHSIYYEMKPTDRVFACAGLAFDASMADTWPTLAMGATLLPIEDPDTRIVPGRLLQFIASKRATMGFLTTQVCEMVLEEDTSNPRDNLQSLRVLYTGGDRLHFGPRAGASYKLVNIYGPTENTINSSMCYVKDGLKTPPYIGAPAPNTTCFVLNGETMRPVPIGVFGELFLGGVQLARGYLGSEQLTSEKFIPNPFDGKGRLYKTGDIVRWVANGQLEFQGRKDTQVKIRGNRVELTAIESKILETNVIKEAIVVAREDNPGMKKLVAYLILNKNEPVETVLTIVKARVSEDLPSFMVPSNYVIMENFPLTANQKVDRRALPAPGAAAVKTKEAPTTSLRRLLSEEARAVNPLLNKFRKVFGEVLNTQVTNEMNFFEQGGDSLSAGQVTSRISTIMGYDVPVSLLYTFPTVEKYCDAVMVTRGHTPVEEEIEQEIILDETMPSFNEQSLWLVSQASNGASSAYNIPFSCKFPKDALDVPRLRASIENMIAKDPSLRASYVTASKGESKIVERVVIDDFVLDFLFSENLTISEEEIRKFFTMETYRCFDFDAESLLIRVRVVKSKDSLYLLIVLHHIITDLWSMVLFVERLFKNYYDQTPLNLPEYTYADFVKDQRKLIVSRRGVDIISFWKRTLRAFYADNYATMVELPWDQARPSTKSFKGVAFPFQIDSETSKILIRMSVRLGFTLNVFLMTMFKILIRFYTGLNKMAIGMPTSGRTSESTESLSGYFVNMVVLCSDLSGNPTLEQLLQRVSQTVLDAIDNSPVPFPALVESLLADGIISTGSDNPLFNIVYVFQKAHVAFPGLVKTLLGFDNSQVKLHPQMQDVKSFATRHLHSQFDVTLMVGCEDDEIFGTLHVNTDVLGKDFGRQFVSHFKQLLSEAAKDGAESRHLSQLNVLTQQEYQEVVVKFNDHKLQLDSDYEGKCVHHLVEAQAMRTPKKVCMDYLDPRTKKRVQMTYDELNRRSNCLSNFLRFSGVRLDVFVPVMLKRGVDLIVTWLAVLKAGGAIMPMDPNFPKERVRTMIEDSRKCPIAVTSSEFKTIFDGLPIRTIYIDEDWDQAISLASSVTLQFNMQQSWNSLAYVIFTSGSTGKPKGVLLEHKSIMNYIFWHIRFYEMTSADRVFACAGLAFDASIADTWPSLAVGATMVPVMDVDTNVVPPKFLDFIARERATMGFLTTQVCEMVLEEDAKSPRKNIQDLRVLYTGGDRLHFSTHTLASYKLVNIYGPTECTVNATMMYVPRGLQGVPLIGAPAPNTWCFILDPEFLQPVPIGVFGELFISGIQVGRGYLNLDSLTSDRFIKNPFFESGYGTERMYKTGDLARWHGDGNIEFMGRKDSQVKIRGNRVELSAIESTILTYPGIKEVIVVAEASKSQKFDDKILVAYFVAEKPQEIARIRKFLKELVPGFMIPSVLVQMKQFPLTANHKVDRVALATYRKESSSQAAVAEVVKETRKSSAYSPLESSVIHIIAEVLGKPDADIGFDDDFFEIGGHSLAAARIMAQIRSIFEIDVSLSKFLLNPTARHLANAVSKEKRITENTHTAPRMSTTGSGMYRPSTVASSYRERSISSYVQQSKMMVHEDSPASISQSFISSHLTKSNLHRLRAESQGRSASASLYAHSPSIDMLVAQSAAAEAATEAAMPISQSGRSVLSYNQQSLWFLYKVDPKRVDYVVHVALEITNSAAFDQVVFQRALQCLVDTHESLRTTYGEENGVPFQNVHVGYDVDFQFVKLDGEAAIASAMDHVLHQPWDLQNASPFRVRLYSDTKTSVYKFIITAHHVALDGWSLDVLLKDLGESYSKLMHGDEPALDANSYTMSTYAKLQKEDMNSASGNRLWSYWQRTLAGHDPVLDLPSDRERVVESWDGAWERFDISEALLTQMMTIVKLERATLFCALLAVYSIMLHRYTGKEDILIGSPMACRNIPELDRTVGNITNVVVLRMRVGALDTFRSLVRQARTVVLGAFENQEFPFPILVEKLSSFRDVTRSPIFQVLLSLNQSFSSDSEASLSKIDAGANVKIGSDLEVKSIQGLEQHTSPYDLALVFNYMTDNDKSSLSGAFQFKTALFDRDTIVSMKRHLISLLEQSVSDFNLCCDKMTIVLPDELSTMVGEWNDTQHEFNEELCAHEMFEERVNMHPYKLAIAWTDNERPFTWTYAELNARANILARYLREYCKVQPNSRVGILLPRSPLMVLAMIATAKSGGVYVPMDVSWPAERFSYVFADSQMQVVIMMSDMALPKKLSVKVIRIDKQWASISTQVSHVSTNLPPPSSSSWGLNEQQWHGSSSTIYMIYTSGSTGNPKGVLVQHRSLVNLIQWHQREYELTCNDRASQLIGSAFDPVTLEIWPFLSSGASVHIVDDHIRSNVKLLRTWLEDHRITVSLLPTPLLELFLKTSDTGSWPKKLRVLYGGGDKLHVPVALMGKLPFRLDNHYGPSEATVMCTRYRCDTAPPPTFKIASWSPSIGKPISNYQIYVLDGNLLPVPPNVTGELYVGGTGVAVGYLNRKDLTTERFLTLPPHVAEHLKSTNPDAQRIYKSGDLVRYTKYGDIEFVGRADFQVKIRGMRVELGEIESVLKQIEVVIEACVIAREDSPGQKRLCAYLVIRVEPNSTQLEVAHQLRSYVKDKLPEYMVPASWIFLEHLPQTSNGKIDRKALPAPDASNDEFARQATAAVVAPRSEEETVLLDLWQKVLGLDTLSIHDNFFDLGGHSLAVTQLLSLVQDTLRIEIPISAFFNAPTVAGMAATVVAMRCEEMEQSVKPLDVGMPQNAGMEPPFDAEVESKLDEDIRYLEGEIPPPPKEWTTVLVTGASGFLGSFLLRELVKCVKKNILCLIRGKSESACIEKLRRSLLDFELFDNDTMPNIVGFQSHFVDMERHFQRSTSPAPGQSSSSPKSSYSGVEKTTIFVLSGDLEVPLFGLDRASFDFLGMSIDLILHGGAFVHSIYPYSRLKRANVDGTKEVLRLAFTPKSHATMVIFVSTLSVFASSENGGDVTFAENGNRTTVKDLVLLEGYAQTKWVAENIVREAHARGLPTCIFRPGRITGDSNSGIAQYSDFMSLFVKGCLQLQCAPDLDWVMDTNPVNEVCRVMLQLASTLTEINGKAFNMRCDNPLKLGQYIEWLCDFGYDCPVVPYDEWREKLVQNIKTSSRERTKRRGSESGMATNVLYPVLPIFTPNRDALEIHVKFESSIPNVIRDHSVINRRCVERMIQRDFISPPAKSEDIFTIE